MQRSRLLISCEFPRACRTLDDLNYWKASEYRHFCCTSGRWFWKLSVHGKTAKTLCISHLPRKLFAATGGGNIIWIAWIVEGFIKLYGATEAKFNLHAWVYICEDVHIHGSPDAFSAFSFESYMQKIWQCITSLYDFRRSVSSHSRAFGRSFPSGETSVQRRHAAMSSNKKWSQWQECK